MYNIWMIDGEIICSKGIGFSSLFVDPIAKFFNKSNIDFEQFMVSMQGGGQPAPLMSVNKGIATMPIMGAIAPASHAMMSMMGGTSIGEVQRSLNEVLHNDKIKGLFIPVDSPGGNTSGIDESAALISQIAKRKPVISQVMGQNGSAAYYLTSGSTKIFANNRTNQIGSIGTKMVIRDESEAMEKAGIKTIVIDTGVNKSVGTQGVPVTEANQDYLRSIVSELQEFFEEAVQQRSNVNINEVNDGSIFLAKQAMEKHLIDGIQPAGKSLAQLQALVF